MLVSVSFFMLIWKLIIVHADSTGTTCLFHEQASNPSTGPGPEGLASYWWMGGCTVCTVWIFCERWQLLCILLVLSESERDLIPKMEAELYIKFLLTKQRENTVSKLFTEDNQVYIAKLRKKMHRDSKTEYAMDDYKWLWMEKYLNLRKSNTNI
jgi:hypothetical protein